MAKNDVKFGAVFAYVLIIINAVYGLIITPYILSSLGDAEYGVYKTISSLSTSLMVLDLGLGGTVMRYISKYRNENNYDKIKNFVSMAFGEGAIILLFMALICTIMYVLLPSIYAKGLSSSELSLAKRLFVVLSANLLLHVIENIVNGIITGYNKFSVGNGAKLVRLLCRILLVYVLLQFIKSALVLVVVDFLLTFALIIVECIYIRIRLKLKLGISLKNWDKSVFGESLKYTLLLFITSIVAQVNNNLDNVVIGSILGPTAVTVYSMGLLIFGMFENLSTSISGVMLPTVMDAINRDDGMNRVQCLIIKVGRVQFALLGAALIGFIILGRDFISLWLGEGYSDVYIITLILMIPSLFELCVNVCLSVLRAKNMLGFRTVVLAVVTLANAIFTVLGVYHFGYIAAAVCTSISFIIGSLIIMNIYYYKMFSFKMIKMYKEIFRGIWLCLIIAGIAIFASSTFLFNDGWISFLLNVLIFVVVYGAMLLLFGLKKDEMKFVPIFNKITNKR